MLSLCNLCCARKSADMAPRDVGKLSAEEFKRFMDSFDYVLSDCDGVLWHMTGPCPGAGELFEGLKRAGKRVAYVSNNSGRTLDQFHEKFRSCGITGAVENLVRPTEAIADYLKAANFDKTIFCVSNSVAVQGLQKYGLRCVVGPAAGGDDFRQYLQYMVDDPEIGAVVFDGDFTVNLPKLYMAAAYLRRPEVHFISGPTDKELPLRKDLNVMGMGQFCDMVADFTRRQPVVLAKPGKPFAAFLLRHLRITEPPRVLFIGDMLEQDVGLGKAAGFQTLLVLGTQTEEQMKNEQRYMPDFYTESLVDFHRQLQVYESSQT